MKRTIGQYIQEQELKNPNIQVVVVIGSAEKDVVRQLNEKSVKKWGIQAGHTARMISKIDQDACLWELTKS